MSNVTLDRVLAVLLVAVGATGFVSLRAGSPDAGWLFAAHGLLGGALLAAAAMKIRRSLPRALKAGHPRRLIVGTVVAALVLTSITIGFTAVGAGSLVVIGPWTLISWHATLGLFLVPLVIVHLLPHRWRLLRPAARRSLADPAGTPGTLSWPRMTRRSLLAGTVLGLAAVGLWEGANVVDRARGGNRRFTGSRWLPAGGVPPPTTFFGEGTPIVDPSTWRLAVRGRVAREATYSLPELAALGETTHGAVLDCTSGWAMDTDWSGVPLSAVLDAAGVDAEARRVDVRAVTGWATTLTMRDAGRSLLATGVAGQPLPAANGAPCRLVVPDRRGLDWVKWVVEVEVV